MTFLIILGGVAALYLGWLMFRLASLALPLYAGIGCTLALLDHGTGYALAIAGGFALGAAILLGGQQVLAMVRSPLLRAMVILLFAVPAGFAGYQGAGAMAALVVGKGAIHMSLSLIAALLTASAAARGLGAAPQRRGDDARSSPRTASRLG